MMIYKMIAQLQPMKKNYSNELKIFGKQGCKCEKCKNIIIKLKVSGRGTHVCKKCQNIYRS